MGRAHSRVGPVAPKTAVADEGNEVPVINRGNAHKAERVDSPPSRCICRLCRVIVVLVSGIPVHRPKIIGSGAREVKGNLVSI